MATPFSKIYDRFFTKITDDMFMNLTEVETSAILKDLLLTAIPLFEFPRVSLEYVEENEEGETIPPQFIATFVNEEIDILAIYMVCAWLDVQLANVELYRMKYSGSDFKMTSQANHMAKLQSLRKDFERRGFHLQRLYSRRIIGEDGIYKPTMKDIMANSTGGYKPIEGGRHSED